MEVSIFTRNTKGEEKRYKSLYDEKEESIYSSAEVMFAHKIWHELVSKRHGHEYMYLRDYYDYDNAFDRLSYAGEGIYYKGKKVMGVDELISGITDIEIKNKIFFIKYLDK